MDGAEQECSDYVFSSASGMLGLHMGLTLVGRRVSRWRSGARAEAKGTVGVFGGGVLD